MLFEELIERHVDFLIAKVIIFVCVASVLGRAKIPFNCRYSLETTTEKSKLPFDIVLVILTSTSNQMRSLFLQSMMMNAIVHD